MAKPRKSSYEFKKVWVWPLGIVAFVKRNVKGKVLHVCCGSSDFGDVKIDKYVKRDDIVNLDFIELPIPDEFRDKFDSVVCDPPWNLAYHLRPRLHYNLRDSLKVGGRLIFNAPWIPRARGLTLMETWLRVPRSFTRNISVWSISVKLQHQLFEYQGKKTTLK